jgi:hypothetical protein
VVHLISPDAGFRQPKAHGHVWEITGRGPQRRIHAPRATRVAIHFAWLNIEAASPQATARTAVGSPSFDLAQREFDVFGLTLKAF